MYITIDRFRDTRDKSGIILFEDMKLAIELADTIEEIVWLKGIIAFDFVYNGDGLMDLLREKEKQIKSPT